MLAKGSDLHCRGQNRIPFGDGVRFGSVNIGIIPLEPREDSRKGVFPRKGVASRKKKSKHTNPASDYTGFFYRLWLFSLLTCGNHMHPPPYGIMIVSPGTIRMFWAKSSPFVKES